MSRISPFIEDIKKRFNEDYSSQNLFNKIKLLLKSYDGNLHKSEDDKSLSFLTEREFIQGITAHINSIDSSLTVFVEPTIGEDRNLRPDLIIQNEKNEKVLIELKVYKRLRSTTFSKSDVNQVVAYLAKAKIKNGFLLLLPRSISSDTELEDVIETFDVGSEKINVCIVREKIR